MGTNTSGLKRTPGFTKENAAEMARRAAEKKKQNNAERKVMRDIALKRVTEADRKEMVDVLIEKAKKGDEKSMTLLLQLLGEMPDVKQTMDLNVKSLSQDDIDLLNTVKNRYERK